MNGHLLADNNFGDTVPPALAGPLGLFIVLVLAAVLVLLIRNMNSRLRRLPRQFPPPGSEPAGTRTRADTPARTGTPAKADTPTRTGTSAKAEIAAPGEARPGEARLGDAGREVADTPARTGTPARADTPATRAGTPATRAETPAPTAAPNRAKRPAQGDSQEADDGDKRSRGQ
jgi:hypothetical protein